MKKIKIGFSFFVLIAICSLTKQFFLLINYLLALFLHEFAHLMVAIYKGYHLRCFRLDIFGMQVELETDIKNKDVFAVNIAGPLMNLFICLLCLLAYWINPNSFLLLGCFSVCNMVLSLFNLLPIYPLDGGKIFYGLIDNYRIYKRVDRIIRVLFALLFILLFVVSCFYGVYNWFLLIMAIFFVVAKPYRKTTFSIFKTGEDKDYSKVVLVEVKKDDKLINVVKQISNQTYTIFYIKTSRPYYIEEDKIINWALNNTLSCTLNDLLIKKPQH